MKQKRMTRFWSIVLSLFMAMSILPAVPAMAAEGDSSTDSLVLSKTATLEEDGTYTIDLEAYATGTTVNSTVEEAVPLDIVLVIDQSGSMTENISSDTYSALSRANYSYDSYGRRNQYYYKAEDGNYYQVSRGEEEYWFSDDYYWLYYKDANNNTVYLSGTGTTSFRPSINDSNATIYTGVLYQKRTSTTTRLAATKTAVSNFVNTIKDKAASDNVNHRIAIAGYASNQNDGTSGGDGYSISAGSSRNSWINTGLFVNGQLKNYGNLNEYDYRNALVSVNNNGNVTRSITTAISRFAASGATRTQYGMKMANNIFANNSIAGTDRKRVVVVFTDGEPGKTGYNNQEASDTLKEAATTKKDISNSGYGATVYTVGLYSSNPQNNVTNFMNYLSSNYPSAISMSATGTQAASTYYMTASDASSLDSVFQSISKDVSNSSTTVTLNQDAVMKDIISNEFTLPTDFNVNKNVTVTTYSSTDGIKKTATSKNNATVSRNGNTIEVTNFNYAEKYISSGHPGEILHVTITGILPTDSAVTGEKVATNTDASGIYTSTKAEEPVAKFSQPQTRLTSESYVLDYAKETDLTITNRAVKRIAADNFKAVSETDTTADGKYGKAVIKDDDNTTLTYTPQTMDWNGTDHYYAMGTYNDESDAGVAETNNGKIWTKVNVIPANNVYYEDNFITEKDPKGQSTGTIGIVYDGFNSVGTARGNKEIANDTAAQGWIASKENETGYSDGSAHGAIKKFAKATFTFTGTGFDIYSRTNLKTGTITVRLDKVNSDTTTKQITYTKQIAYVVNTYAESGDYYQIPTAFMYDLDYATYQVTITVGSDAVNDGENYSYYLDGVRIYNPLDSSNKMDEAALDAYDKAHELNATFYSVREILIEDALKANSATIAGAVFVDNNENETEEGTKTKSVSSYVSDGPKNEVYLASKQLIGFGVSTVADSYYYVGLKAPNGETTVKITNDKGVTEPIKVTGASDQYVRVTPNANGYIVIQNTGEKMLSITKLRTTGNGSVAKETSLESLMNYINEFEILTNVKDDTPEYEELTEGDVDSENSDETSDSGEVSGSDENESNDSGSSSSFIRNIFNQMFNWFRGRR